MVDHICDYVLKKDICPEKIQFQYFQPRICLLYFIMAR